MVSVPGYKGLRQVDREYRAPRHLLDYLAGRPVSFGLFA